MYCAGPGYQLGVDHSPSTSATAPSYDPATVVTAVATSSHVTSNAGVGATIGSAVGVGVADADGEVVGSGSGSGAQPDRSRRATAPEARRARYRMPSA
jgi:hypothetical protein